VRTAEDLLKDSFAVMSDHEPRFSWLDHNHSSSAAVKFVDADDSEYEVSRFFTYVHARLMAVSGTTQVSWYQKGKTVWILLKHETVSGIGISWAICKSASCSRQITMPAPHHFVFYRPDALSAAQPTAPKH